MSLLSVSVDLDGAFVLFVGLCLVILIAPLRRVVNLVMFSASSCGLNYFDYFENNAVVLLLVAL